MMKCPITSGRVARTNIYIKGLVDPFDYMPRQGLIESEVRNQNKFLFPGLSV